MKHKILLKRIFSFTVIAGVTLAVLLILQSPSRPGPTSAATARTTIPHTTEAVKKTAASYDLPVRIKIPKINIDAPIDQMGITPQGDMQAPSGLQNVGWYKLGPRPGDIGSAVIAGHFGRAKNGELSVFDALHTLSAGDIITTEDQKGQVATFEVRELQTFSQNHAAPTVFSSNDGKAHLNLITCQGTWIEAEQTYSKRLVVFSTKE